MSAIARANYREEKKMNNRQLNYNEALFALEIQEERFHNLLKSPTFELALRRLEELKSKVRMMRKILAKKYHPDVCKDSNGLEKMQKVNFYADALLSLDIKQQHRMRPQVVHVHVHRAYNPYSNIYSDDATSNSTYTSTNQW
jgi:hypothetical protein